MKNLIFLFIISLFSFSQNEKNEFATISGFVSDISSGENLIGVNIYLDSLDLGTTTNKFGFYSVTVPTGNININFSFVGYETYSQNLHINQNITLNTPLSISSLSQEKVYVDLFNHEVESEMDHISLSRWADIILIAPITANTISKLYAKIFPIT